MDTAILGDRLPEVTQKPPERYAPSSNRDRLSFAVSFVPPLWFVLDVFRNQTCTFRCKIHGKIHPKIRPDPLQSFRANSFYFGELFSVYCTGDTLQHKFWGNSVFIGAGLPQKPRIIQLQLQFFTRCCAGIHCCNVIPFLLQDVLSDLSAPWSHRCSCECECKF